MLAGAAGLVALDDVLDNELLSQLEVGIRAYERVELYEFHSKVPFVDFGAEQCLINNSVSNSEDP